MADDSRPPKKKGFFVTIILSFLVGSFLIYLPLHTVIQRPDARPIVLCDDVYSLTKFVWVDVFLAFQPSNNVGRTEHLINVNNLRYECLDFAENQEWLKKIPYPSFLYGENY
jgi:hypothetical protein